MSLSAKLPSRPARAFCLACKGAGLLHACARVDGDADVAVATTAAPAVAANDDDADADAATDDDDDDAAYDDADDDDDDDDDNDDDDAAAEGSAARDEGNALAGPAAEGQGAATRTRP
jgi:hypothetical protein